MGVCAIRRSAPGVGVSCEITCRKRNLGLPTGFTSFEGVSGSYDDAVLQLRPHGIRIDRGGACPGISSPKQWQPEGTPAYLPAL